MTFATFGLCFALLGAGFLGFVAYRRRDTFTLRLATGAAVYVLGLHIWKWLN